MGHPAVKWWLVALLGCQADGDTHTCMAPSNVETKNCDPVPTGSVGCTGMPQATALEGIWPLDPSLTYPVGCVVIEPFCSAVYPDAQTAECTNSSGQVDWLVGI